MGSADVLRSRRTVDGHQDLPSDSREVDAMVITASNRIRWSSRREICSERCRIGARGAEGRIKVKGRSDWPVLHSAKCPSYLPAAGPCALTRDLARTGRCRCPILGASSAPARRTAAVLQSA